MDFSNSKLPHSPLLEKAFKYSFDNIMSQLPEHQKMVEEQIHGMHQQQLMFLEAERQNGMPEEQYKEQKEAIDKMLADQLKIVPAMIKDGLINNFENRRVRAALEIAHHCEKPVAELMAAVMLLDCVRSPLDYLAIEKNFGATVAGVIAELVHIDAYPSERNINLGAAADDTKRAYLALMTTGLDMMVAQIRETIQMNPMMQPSFPPGQEQQFYFSANLVWGNDKKQDARFVDVFNQAASSLSSEFRMDIAADGSLELVKGTGGFGVPRIGFDPKKPPSGPGKGSLGGKIF